MNFDELFANACEALHREQRISYRALRRRFELSDDDLEDLKVEIIEAKQLALDENDRILVWIDKAATIPEPAPAQPSQPEKTQETEPTEVEPPAVESHTPEAERRQLTVIFWDLVGSTSLSGELDPEDLRDIVKAYQAACTNVIQHYDGHVAQLLGDGLLVYFGYPQAHEDDAQRAVRTGLGIMEAISELNTKLERDKDIKLAVRLGIHTGLVVVGEMGGAGRQEQLALGETPNIAARIQGLAEPDTVVMSDATHRLVQGYFDCETLRERELRGVADPVVVYQVLRDSGVQRRLDIASTRGLTPLVGREQGFAMLEAPGMIKRGQALAMQGREDEGITQIRHGLDAWQSTGATLAQSDLLTSLAEAYRVAGRKEEGLIALAEALAMVDKHDERWYEAELHRLKGELLLQQSSDNATEAETCFNKAITIAQNQSAKSWELRAATSLAKLWQSQGKREEARELLGDVYAFFTEGFDTADLIDAKTLLDELA